MRPAGSFWERRRAAVRAEADAEAQIERQRAAEERIARRDAMSDDEVRTELGLPDPSAMKAGDDFAAFMSREVPERLRRQALRSLWRSNPVLACLDGLNDYDDDYRAAAAGQGPLKTAYKVGRGLARHVEAQTMQARAETDPVADASQTVAAAAPVTEPAVPSHEEAGAPEPVARDSAADETQAPRRMRFRFEEVKA